MFQIQLALRYLSGRKMRTALTTAAIAFGVMIIFGMNGMITPILESFRQSIMATAGKTDLTLTSETRGAFDTSVLDRVANTPGVLHVTGVLTQGIAVPTEMAPKDTNGKAVGNLMLNGLDPVTGSEVRQLLIETGRPLEPGDTDSMVIASTLAEKTGLNVDDTVTLPSGQGTSTFTIVGISKEEIAAGTDNVYVPLSAAQTILNLPGQINQVDALFSANADAEATRAAALANAGPIFKLGENQAGSELANSIDMGTKAFSLFGVLALAMGGFVIFNTFRTLIIERRRDIGMLRAIGASRRTILVMILVESMIQGVIGTAVGLLLGYGMVIGILNGIRGLWETQMHMTLGGPSFTADNFALSIGLGIGITILSGIFPARAASRISPLDAMRPSMAEVHWGASARRAVIGAALVGLALICLFTGQMVLQSLGALLFVLGLILVTPILIYPITHVFGRLLGALFAREGQIAQGNLVRQPGRAANTVATLMIGMAILISLAGIVSTLTRGLYSYLENSMTADYILMPQSLILGGGNVGSGTQLLEDIRKTPGIEAATSLRQSTTMSGDTNLQVIGLDPATYPEVSGLQFGAGKPDQAYAALSKGRSAIVNGVFAGSKIKVGQDITLQTVNGPQIYHVVGIANDLLNFKISTAYISQADLANDFHVTSDLMLLANQKKGADSAVVEASLKEVAKPYPAFYVYSMREWLDVIDTTMLSKINIVYVLMVILAVPSLIALANTLSISVLERTREIGMLRAVGSTRTQIKRMILAESLLLAAAGIAFGILAGLWLGYIMVGALQTSGFVFKSAYMFPTAGVLIAIATGLIFGIVASLIPARQAAKMDIVAALQYE